MSDALTATITAVIRLIVAATVIVGSAPVFRGTSTQIRIGAEVTCTSYAKWCYRIALIEQDGVKADAVDNAGIHCEDSWTANRVYLNGSQNGDGLFDNFYEFELLVVHNCTDDGKLRLIRKRFEKLPVNTKEYNTEWRAEMTNKGERVDSYFNN